ncbi:MAG: DUF3313 domain-containing protein [Deltaproteobacteria bacterium]|nr:DUF3313 domain-containing protein [Deltaproteobacteria bacterium]
MRRWQIMMLLVAVVSLAACAAPKGVHEDVKPGGFLGADAAKLEPGGPGQPAWIYVNPMTKWPSYDKMLLDPVTFWRDPGAPDQGISMTERQKLANYFYQVIYKAMSKQITMVSTPGPGTLRVQVALTKAVPSKVGLDVISTVVPQAVVISSLKDAVTGKPSFVGEAAVASKVTDAETGELLGAWVADRIGGKQLDAAEISTWGDVEQAMRFWADNAAYRLCKRQGKPNCVKPPQQ